MRLPSLASNRLTPSAWTAASAPESPENVRVDAPPPDVGADHRSVLVALSQTWSIAPGPPSMVATTVPSGENAAAFTNPVALGSVDTSAPSCSRSTT